MHAMAIYLDGTDSPDEAEDGTPLLDDDFLILVNAWWGPVPFTIPPVREAAQTWFWSWTAMTRPSRPPGSSPGTPGIGWWPPRSLTVLRAPESEKDETD